MFTTITADGATEASRSLHPLYHAAWRWHFYAGLFVIPFLLMLSVTGFGMMVLTTVAPEYGEGLSVAPATELLSPEAQVASAVASISGGTGYEDYVSARLPGHAVLVTVTGPTPPVVVALDPGTGRSLRQTPEGGTWSAFLQKIHRTLLVGNLGDRLIEMAAGLGFLLLATGLYIWWPRRGWSLREALVPRLDLRGRAFWKSLHSTIGFWLSALLLAFLLTGMSWTGIWGERWVQAWSTLPAEKFDAPLSEATHARLNVPGEKRVPWPLEQTPLPLSASDGGVPLPGTAKPHHGGPAAGAMRGMEDMPGMDHDRMDELAPPDLATLLTLAETLGMTAKGRVHINPPQEATGVWTLSQDSMSYDSADPTADRTLHIDRYTGKLLGDVRFEDYSWPAKAMAAGIALHEGQVGLWNLALNAAVCGLTVLLCISGAAVWWKRRPAGVGRLAAPPRPAELPVWKGALALALSLSMLFPLVGATLIGVLLFDILVLQKVRPLRRLLT
ncbi:putative iron-regulated membrane protein [Rhodobacter sp. AKP1]|nr:putative iron-regulated membrane protein [Rhodobacter sp. AKP1]